MLAVGVGAKKLMDGNREFQLIVFPPSHSTGLPRPPLAAVPLACSQSGYCSRLCWML